MHDTWAPLSLARSLRPMRVQNNSAFRQCPHFSPVGVLGRLCIFVGGGIGFPVTEEPGDCVRHPRNKEPPVPRADPNRSDTSCNTNAVRRPPRWRPRDRVPRVCYWRGAWQPSELLRLLPRERAFFYVLVQRKHRRGSHPPGSERHRRDCAVGCLRGHFCLHGSLCDSDAVCRAHVPPRRVCNPARHQPVGPPLPPCPAQRVPCEAKSSLTDDEVWWPVPFNTAGWSRKKRPGRRVKMG
eukprot:Rmarinus@m.844